MTDSQTHAIPPEHEPGRVLRPIAGQPRTRLSGNAKTALAPDPFFEIFTVPGVTTPLWTFHEARAAAARGAGQLPAAYRRKPGGVRALLESKHRNAVLNLLGALVSFRAMTNNQAAAITGEPAFADPRSALVAELFTTGLIKLSPALKRWGLGVAGDTAAVYSLGPNKTVRCLEPLLSYAEWLAVTGGRPLPDSAVNVRHDVLGTHLALFAADLPGVATVLGPRFSEFKDLAHPSDLSRTARGGPDLAIVRSDGLRVAVEITASIGAKFKKKVERWGRILAASPVDRSGLVVIFLVAPPLSSDPDRAAQTRRQTYKVAFSAAREFAGSHLDRTAERLGVATWTEWFPAPQATSQRFDLLMVDRPTGSQTTWESASMLDPSQRPLPNHRGRPFLGVAENSLLLGQTPVSIRRRHQPERLSVQRLRERAPTFGPTSPLRSRSGQRAVGRGQGAAADSLIPARLVGPTGDPARSAHQAIDPRPQPLRLIEEPGRRVPTLGSSSPAPADTAAATRRPLTERSSGPAPTPTPMPRRRSRPDGLAPQPAQQPDTATPPALSAHASSHPVPTSAPRRRSRPDWAPHPPLPLDPAAAGQDQQVLSGETSHEHEHAPAQPIRKDQTR